MIKLAIVLSIINLATFMLALFGSILLTILGIKVLKEKEDANDIVMGILILFFASGLFLIFILLLILFFI